MLAIEIDGETHNFRMNRDKERQKRLEGLGVWFLRFTDEEVKQNIEGVVEEIERWIRKNDKVPAEMHPPLHPSQEGNCETRKDQTDYENDV